MRSDVLDGRLRRYVLGTLTEPECDAIEREYFAQEDALDRVTAAEDDLIDDYLSSGLSVEEREQFERHYLSTPCHRRSVAVARAIRAAASARSLGGRAVDQSLAGRGSRLRPLWLRWLAAAGCCARASCRVRGGDREPITADYGGQDAAIDSRSVRLQQICGVRISAPPTPVPPSPVVVAASISPILVRGSDKASTLSVKPGTDVVRLMLQEGERGERPLGQGRAIVRTVAGRDVWQGAAGSAGSRSKELARIEIPASLLQPDDYIIELFGTDPHGAVVERYRYFLSVRSP